MHFVTYIFMILAAIAIFPSFVMTGFLGEASRSSGELEKIIHLLIIWSPQILTIASVLICMRFPSLAHNKFVIFLPLATIALWIALYGFYFVKNTQSSQKILKEQAAMYESLDLLLPEGFFQTDRRHYGRSMLLDTPEEKIFLVDLKEPYVVHKNGSEYPADNIDYSQDRRGTTLWLGYNKDGHTQIETTGFLEHVGFGSGWAEYNAIDRSGTFKMSDENTAKEIDYFHVFFAFSPQNNYLHVSLKDCEYQVRSDKDVKIFEYKGAYLGKKIEVSDIGRLKNLLKENIGTEDFIQTKVISFE